MSLLSSKVFFRRTAPSLFLFGFLLAASTAHALVAELAVLQPTAAQSATAKEVVEQLESRHYTRQKLDDTLSSALLDNYLKRLDPNRMVFLQTDVSEFEKYRLTLDDFTRSGNLGPAFTIFNRYQERIEARLESSLKDLPATIAGMNFTTNETLPLESTDEPWPASEAEANARWLQRIKSSVLSLRLADKAQADIAPLLEKRYRNQLNRVRQSNAEDAFQVYINALTELYDPHTNYLSPATSENFNINMSLSLEGIGAVLQTEDDFTKVVRLVPAGPADKQGELKPADRIIAVAQGEKGEFVDVVGMRLDEVVQLIRGKKDSIVRLEVIPASAQADDVHKTITLVRSTVKLEEQSAQKEIIEIMHDGQLYKLGVIDIPAFYIDFEAARRGDEDYKSTTRDVAHLLEELLKEPVDGVIIDLRENGGGSLQEATALTSLFIDSGPTVQLRHANTRVQRDGKRMRTPYYDGPLLVLINRLSASASEIFAGAIQDYQRGLVVGSQSFGKGTVQTLSPLSQGQLKITEQKFYRISGESTQHRGVLPDIDFPSLYDDSKVGESALDTALPWDTIDPAPYRHYIDMPSLLPELVKKHQQRAATDPDFVFLNEQLKEAEKVRAIDTISLNEAVRREERLRDKTLALAMENRRRTAKGLEALEALEESSEEEDEIPVADAPVAIDTNDPLLIEAANILADSIAAMPQERVAAQEALN